MYLKSCFIFCAYLCATSAIARLNYIYSDDRLMGNSVTRALIESSQEYNQKYLGQGEEGVDAVALTLTFTDEFPLKTKPYYNFKKLESTDRCCSYYEFTYFTPEGKREIRNVMLDLNTSVLKWKSPDVEGYQISKGATYDYAVASATRTNTPSISDSEPDSSETLKETPNANTTDPKAKECEPLLMCRSSDPMGRASWCGEASYKKCMEDGMSSTNEFFTKRETECQHFKMCRSSGLRASFCGEESYQKCLEVGAENFNPLEQEEEAKEEPTSNVAKTEKDCWANFSVDNSGKFLINSKSADLNENYQTTEFQDDDGMLTFIALYRSLRQKRAQKPNETLVLTHLEKQYLENASKRLSSESKRITAMFQSGGAYYNLRDTPDAKLFQDQHKEKIVLMGNAEIAWLADSKGEVTDEFLDEIGKVLEKVKGNIHAKMNLQNGQTNSKDDVKLCDIHPDQDSIESTTPTIQTNNSLAQFLCNVNFETMQTDVSVYSGRESKCTSLDLSLGSMQRGILSPAGSSSSTAEESN